MPEPTKYDVPVVTSLKDINSYQVGEQIEVIGAVRYSRRGTDTTEASYELIDVMHLQLNDGEAMLYVTHSSRKFSGGALENITGKLVEYDDIIRVRATIVSTDSRCVLDIGQEQFVLVAPSNPRFEAFLMMRNHVMQQFTVIERALDLYDGDGVGPIIFQLTENELIDSEKARIEYYRSCCHK